MIQNQEIKLTLNCIKIDFDDSIEIQVGIQDYKDKEQLRELRKNHKNTHFFKRQGNKIFSISLEKNIEPLGDETKTFKLNEIPNIVSQLALNSIKNYFETVETSDVIKTYPLIVKNKKNNLLEKIIPTESEYLDWFQINNSYTFETRELKIGKVNSIVLSFNSHIKISIQENCKKLVEKDINIVGLYVQKIFYNEETKSEFKKLVGKVESIDNDIIKLIDNIEGIEKIPLEEAYLEPRFENLKICISKLFGNNAQIDLQNIYESRSKGEAKFNSLKSLVKYLKTQNPYKLLYDINFNLGDFVTQKYSNNFPKYEIIYKPQLIFDPSGMRKDTWNQRGLDDHGPYDQNVFSPTKPRIAVICQKNLKGRVEEFLSKFFDGMPNVKVGYGENKKAPYSKGFIKRFCLDDVEVEYFLTENESSNSYSSACKKAIGKSAETNKKWDFSIVQIEDSFHLLNDNENPYLITKSLLLKQQIPVQEIEIETMSKLDTELVYILNNISLASYAKMGGKPWLLQSNRTMAHELIFGIGSSVIKSGRLGENQKIVGITTVFTGDGNYLLSNRSSSVPYEEYSQAILDSLRETITTVREEQNWTKKDPVRLIFHIFKPLKNTETDSIKNVMEELKEYDVEYAFLTFTEEHPYYLFDENNNGNYGKGKLAPPRGLSVILSSKASLLSFISSNELKRREDGIPKPVLLKLHHNSTFTDLTYLARQAFHFSCHSWRMLTPSHLPITILYSDLISGLLGKLNNINNWDSDTMLGRIGRTRWFL